MGFLDSIFGEKPEGPDMEAINEILADYFNHDARDVMRFTMRQNRLRNRQVLAYGTGALNQAREGYRGLVGSQKSALMDLDRTRQSSMANMNNDLAARGLGNTTIGPSNSMAMNTDFSRARAGIEADYASRMAAQRGNIGNMQLNLANLRGNMQQIPNMGGQLTMMRKLARQGVFTGVKDEGSPGLLGQLGILGGGYGNIGGAIMGLGGMALGGLGGAGLLGAGSLMGGGFGGGMLGAFGGMTGQFNPLTSMFGGFGGGMSSPGFMGGQFPWGGGGGGQANNIWGNNGGGNFWNSGGRW